MCFSWNPFGDGTWSPNCIWTTKETTKEVARPRAAPPLLWWQPQAATCVFAVGRVNTVAVNAILVLHFGRTGRRTVGRTPLGIHVPSPFGFRVPSSIVKFPKFSENTISGFGTVDPLCPGVIFFVDLSLGTVLQRVVLKNLSQHTNPFMLTWPSPPIELAPQFGAAEIWK